MEKVNDISVMFENPVAKFFCIIGIFTAFAGLFALLRMYFLQGSAPGQGIVEFTPAMVANGMAVVFFIFTLAKKEFQLLHIICVLAIGLVNVLLLFPVNAEIASQISGNMVLLLICLLFIPVKFE